MMRITLLIIMLTMLPGLSLGRAQGYPKTYSETRKLLLKLDRSSSSKALRKLFEEADVRMSDLIRALDDPEERVNLNSQVIIRYLADPEGLRAADEWVNRRKAGGKDYWYPPIYLLLEPRYLEGTDSDLARLVIRNKHLFAASKFNGGEEVSARLIAYNRREKAALVEIVQGRVLTAGWHVVIKLEGEKWRLISDNMVWVT